MGLIAFTSFASIAGSVAWFTASRQVSINAGTYAVVKTTTNLKVAVTAGYGTTVSGTTVSTGSNKLTDASFNHASKKIFVPNEAGEAVDKVVTFGTPSEDSSAKEVAISDSTLERADLGGGAKVYSAFTWNVAFTISFGATSGDYGLFLNNTASQSRFETSGTAYTAKGFRIAIVGNTAPEGSATVSKVFADLQTDDDGASGHRCKYVSDIANFGGTAYTSGSLIDSSYSTALPTNETTRAAALARNDYLGHFGFVASSEVTLNYTVVAWFEGTDPEIINRTLEAEYQAVTAYLVFDAVKLNAAA